MKRTPASIALAVISLVVSACGRDAERARALDMAHLASIPASAEVVGDDEDGWHSRRVRFRAEPGVVRAWIAASPALRSARPTTDTTGEVVFPCERPPPPHADPDTVEGDCTRVRVSRDGRVVTMHLVIAQAPAR